VRLRGIFNLLVPFLLFVHSSAAQSPTGTISGMVTDPSGGTIADAEVLVVNDATRVQFTGKTNNEGIYVVPSVPPGSYRIQVSKVGFKTIIKPDITVNVQDALAINFALPLGSVSEVVTIQGGAPLVNTQDAAVSTVVDRRFVENMPLNGRSFQSLITLAPGVVVTPATATNPGQFSVSGQRTDANYFTVDGVSANAGVSAVRGLGQSAGGSLPALTVSGGTNGLVSVDAMQEFRIQTSSFAPEFGRTPGAQISLVTRSGTDQFHGTLFEYLRNDVLDANNWFAALNGQPKPRERQNDFGGVLGGPILKDRTFFFFSYEGLRLRQPVFVTAAVPSLVSREAAPAAIRPFLEAYPMPNGSDLGNGFGQFAIGYSIPATLNAYSIRFDHVVSSKFKLFGRYSYAPSSTITRGSGGVASDTVPASVNTQTLTLGLNQVISPVATNEIRANYTNVKADARHVQDTLGGAVPLTDAEMFPEGSTSANAQFLFTINGAGTVFSGPNATSEQRQLNFVDAFSVNTGAHQLKFGADYRWLSPIADLPNYSLNVFFTGINGAGGALAGIPPFGGNISAQSSVTLLEQNFSLYGQDTWRISARLSLTYGLRWDINPAPTGKGTQDQPFAGRGVDNAATLALAPAGAPLYDTTYGNVAPRIGAAYQIRQSQNTPTVFRAGFGVFYDIGVGAIGQLVAGFPFTATKNLGTTPFPFTAGQAAPPVIATVPPVLGQWTVANPNLTLPRSYQWNVALEQSLGQSQSVSVTYVGAIGRELLRESNFSAPNADFPGAVSVTQNTGTSDYHALQLKFQRRLTSGLQALASYTWSHSLDNASSDFASSTPTSIASANIDRGSSDFDIRNAFNGAVSYDVPFPAGHRAGMAVFGGWSIDGLLTARSALPVNVIASTFVVGGAQFVSRPNVVEGVPLYLYGSEFPGGKAINRAAFTNPPTGEEGDLGRNALRGFPAWQADLTVRRQFHLTDRIGLQFRTDFFNVFNHPNFGDPGTNNSLTNQLTSALFGRSTQTLASSLGSGGLLGGFNPLYQVGGPRSIQVALKLQF
jgi:hypothetical protein